MMYDYLATLYRDGYESIYLTDGSEYDNEYDDLYASMLDVTSYTFEDTDLPAGGEDTDTPDAGTSDTDVPDNRRHHRHRYHPSLPAPTPTPSSPAPKSPLR